MGKRSHLQRLRDWKEDGAEMRLELSKRLRKGTWAGARVGHSNSSPVTFRVHEGPSLTQPAKAHKEMPLSSTFSPKPRKVKHMLTSLENVGILERNIP